jgi:tetratricopeptide (TPR) repeat protein
MARFRLALALTDHGQFAQAARLCQSIIDFDDPEFESNPEIIHLLGITSYASGQADRAEKALRVSAQVSVRKENKATALFYLSRLARKRGDEEAAKQYYQQATSVPGLDPAYLRAMEEQQRPP